MEKEKMKQNSERVFCGDRLRGCGASLTEVDLELGHCSQCGYSLEPQPLPLEQQLLESIDRVQSRRDAEVV